jgi:hypothetical protein
VETVAKVITSLVTTLSGASQSDGPISVPGGTAVTDQATFVGFISDPGGTVTYSVYSDSACTLGAASADTVNVTDGSIGASNPVTLYAAGMYYWKATYSGDANNTPSATTCGPSGEVETVTSSVSPPLPPLPPTYFSITTTTLNDAKRGSIYRAVLLGDARAIAL